MPFIAIGEQTSSVSRWLLSPDAFGDSNGRTYSLRRRRPRDRDRGQTKKGRSQDLTANNIDPSANATLEFFSSKDGGETLGSAAAVAQLYMDRPRFEGGNLGQLAVDGTRGPFK